MGGKLARGVQRLKRQTQKVFADKQGLPGNWAPLVQEVRGLSSGVLVCRDPEALGEACGQGVARVEEPPRWVRFPGAAVL